MKIRKIAYKLHLWVGLVTGLIVFIVCLTGCVWAFKLNGWIDGKVSVASVTKAHGFMRPSVAVARSSAAVGDIQPESVTYTPEGVVEVAFRDSSGVTSVSLDAAEGDNSWTAEIKSFWNEHLPICLSLKDGYSYYALCLKDGTIVTGEEPEFEETTEVAPSFRDFLQMLCNGELDLE